MIATDVTIMTNTQFVKIDLDEDEDEQQIFDTINSLGVNLMSFLPWHNASVCPISLNCISNIVVCPVFKQTYGCT